MTLLYAADRIDGKVACRKDILPGKFTFRIRVFSPQGIGEVDGAQAHGEVKLVLGSHLFEMETQRFEQDIWKHGDPVILPFPITDDDLAIVKIQILDPQTEHLDEAKPTAIHELDHGFVNAFHIRDHRFRLRSRKHGRHTFGLGRANRDQRFFVQFDAQDIPIQEEDGTDRLVLSGGRDFLLVDEVGDEVVDLCHAHLTGIALIVVEDVLARPADVGLFSAKRVMAVA
jgi:hypothetical protein